MIRLLGIVMLLLGGLPAVAETPGEPIVRAELDKQSAVPGQPIILRVTVLGPTWFPEPPVFPSFEVRNVMARLPSQASGPTSQEVDGETWSGVTRAYRLYPMIAGDFRIPPQEIMVKSADPAGGDPKEYALRTDEISFAGIRPEGTEDLDPFVAADGLTLEQNLEGLKEALAPGDAVTRTIVVNVKGTSPIFVPPLLDATTVDGIAVYQDEPELSETNERGLLSGERRERVTYVAESNASFSVPPVSLDWYNVQDGKIETATADGFELVVSGGAVAATASGFWREHLLWVAGIVLLVTIAALAAMLMRHRVRDWIAGRHERWLASEPYACGEVRRTLQRRDLAVLYRNLDVWRHRLPTGVGDMPAELNAVLLKLGSSKYGNAGAHEDWAEARRAFEGARSAMMSRLRDQARPSILPPLNPTGNA